MTKNLNRIISKPFILKHTHKTTEMSYYCNTEGRTPGFLKSHLLYEFGGFVCNSSYCGKTDRNLGTQKKGHCGLDKNSPIFNHLVEFNWYQYSLTLYSFLCDGDVTLTNQD